MRRGRSSDQPFSCIPIERFADHAVEAIVAGSKHPTSRVTSPPTGPRMCKPRGPFPPQGGHTQPKTWVPEPESRGSRQEEQVTLGDTSAPPRGDEHPLTGYGTYVHY